MFDFNIQARVEAAVWQALWPLLAALLLLFVLFVCRHTLKKHRPRWHLLGLAAFFALFALPGTAQQPVWFRADFNNLGPNNLYNFGNRYAQSTTTWQTEHLPTGGWNGTGGALVRIKGCLPGGPRPCTTAENQFNTGWQTPNIGTPLGRPWQIGDQFFLRFRLRPVQTANASNASAKFILYGSTGTSPNSRVIWHWFPPYHNGGCSLGFESYAFIPWAAPSFVWTTAAQFGVPAWARDVSNHYFGIGSNINIGWNCLPHAMLHDPTVSPAKKPQNRGAAPIGGWYHLQFQVVSGLQGTADFRSWVNTNDQANPSSEHVNMARPGDPTGDFGDLGVAGWTGAIDFVGYWGIGQSPDIEFAVDDFEVGGTFDPTWYPGGSQPPPVPLPLTPPTVRVTTNQGF